MEWLLNVVGTRHADWRAKDHVWISVMEGFIVDSVHADSHG